MPEDTIIINTILNKKIACEAESVLRALGYENVYGVAKSDQGLRFAMLDKYFPYLI